MRSIIVKVAAEMPSREAGVWAERSALETLKKGRKLSDYHRMVIASMVVKLGFAPAAAFDKMVNDLIDEYGIDHRKTTWSVVVFDIIHKYLRPEHGFTEEDAEDAFQEVFVDLFKDGGKRLAEKFDPSRAKFMTYFVYNVNSKVLDIYRSLTAKTKSRFNEDDLDAFDPEYVEGLEELGVDASSRTQLLEMYQIIKENAKSSNIVKTFIGFAEGMKQREIADSLGVSTAAIVGYKRKIQQMLEAAGFSL